LQTRLIVIRYLDEQKTGSKFGLMRYARRRGREDEMKKILEEIEAAEA
jgi:hypothetical protein